MVLTGSIGQAWPRHAAAADAYHAAGLRVDRLKVLACGLPDDSKHGGASRGGLPGQSGLGCSMQPCQLRLSFASLTLAAVGRPSG